MRTLPFPTLPHGEPSHPVFLFLSVLVTPGRTASSLQGMTDKSYFTSVTLMYEFSNE